MSVSFRVQRVYRIMSYYPLVLLVIFLQLLHVRPGSMRERLELLMQIFTGRMPFLPISQQRFVAANILNTQRSATKLHTHIRADILDRSTVSDFPLSF